ncbi:TPA: hypothetical protein NQQ05_004647 [Klebsiella pneumoniae]|nr:hypothetical protein [Klebsiella pneumoniae]
MNDISITDYLGPGVYLLQNYPKETEGLIAEKGYKVHNCADLAQCKDILNRNKVNFLLTNDKDNNFNEYVKIVRTAARQLVNKIVINIFVEKGNGQSFQDFINITDNLGYSIDTVFYLLNPGYDEQFRDDQSLKIVLSYRRQSGVSTDKNILETTIFEKKLVNTFPYIRPGDRVLVIIKNKNSITNIKNIIAEQTKASEVEIYSLDEIKSVQLNGNCYHFLITDKYADDGLNNALKVIISYLVPAGRYVSFHTDKTVVETLSNYNLQPEVYLFYEHGHLKTQIHQGEEITLSPELCVFMKSPLARSELPYQETIYGYSHPPKNLLAFARDYTNPWLIRGIVEFPFRNRSTYHLQQYSHQILEHSAPDSPDYAAALAVLGYQMLSGSDDTADIYAKMLDYCSNVSQMDNPTPHQYRWLISLSTLLGLICNKNNDKTNALIHLSRAANSSIDKFSPSIGTKILQSFYLQSVILISLNRISCAEIIVDRGIKRGIQLLYQHPDELVGKISQPFNFVLYIYHDILDWLIKMVNIKNAIPGRKFNIANFDNGNTWSALLHERMNAINNMSQMIDERDRTIHDQKCLIDERDRTIHDQKRLIDERDSTVLTQKNLIDERDLVSAQQNQLIEQNNKTIQQQIQNVTDLNSQVSSKEQKVDELQNQNIKLISLIDEKDLHIAQLSADLERANTILRNINSTPVIRHLLRMLNIK